MAEKKKHDSGSKRRRPLGTLSKSGKYLRTHPRSAAKKNAYNRKARAKAVATGTSTRAERAKKTTAARKRGVNTKGKDYDHAVGRFVSQRVNRGRKGEGNRKKKR